MIKSSRSEYLTAAVLMAPFVVIYAIFFVYPTIKMVELSFTNAPLIGPGKWVGLDNYFRLASDRLFSTAVWNTIYFVVLSVPTGTLLALLIALGVTRLKGWLQSLVLAAFFLPYILPVSVVIRIWGWMFDKDFGVAQYLIAPLNDGQRISVFRTVPLFMPAVASITVWWCLGFSLLLFVAGLGTFRPKSTRPPTSTARAAGTSSRASPGRSSGRSQCSFSPSSSSCSSRSSIRSICSPPGPTPIWSWSTTSSEKPSS